MSSLSFLPLSPLQLTPPTNNLLPGSVLFWIFPINGIIQYMVLCDWFLSYTTWENFTVFFCREIIHCTNIFCLSFHQLAGHWIVSTFWGAAMNTCVQVFVQTQLCRSRIAELYVNFFEEL